MIYVVLIFAFLLRITPRLILPYAISDDGFSHLEDVQILKRNGYVPPKYYTKTVFKQLFGYPFGVMYLFSVLPRKLQLAAEILISPLSDTLMIFFAYKFFKYFCFVNHIIFDESYFCLFALLLATLSVYLRNDSGPRAYNGSARVFSQLLFVCMNYSFFRYHITADYLYLGISVFLSFMLIFSSIFGTQVLFLSSIIIVCSGIWMYTVVPVGGLVLFYMLTWHKGHQMIVARLWHYEWYFKFFQRVHLQHWSFLASPLSDYLKNVKSWFKLAINFNLKSLIIYINIYNNPVHLLLASYFCYFFAVSKPVTELVDSHFVIALCIGCLVAFVATLFKQLLFLGESYRYLEFGVTFAMVLFFVFLNNLGSLAYYLIIAWVVVGLIRYVFYQIEFFKKYNKENKNYKQYIGLFEKLNKLIEGNVYASAHFRTKGAYFGNFKYIALRGLQSIRIEPIKSHQLAFAHYPMPDNNYREIIRHFDLNYWLTTRKEFEVYCSRSAEQGDIKKVMELVHENKELDVLLFRIDKNKL